MKCTRVALTTKPQVIIAARKDNKILQIKNTDTAGVIYIQFGESPGHQDDAWPLAVGELLRFAANVPLDKIWIWGSANGILNNMMIG